MLDAFEDRLRAQDPEEKADARAEQKQWAAEHGTHRWQQGYRLTETMREWGHLQLCLLTELERYSAQHTELEPEVLQVARRELVRLANDGVCASASRYTQLQQSEAAGRLYDLETALDALHGMELERAEGWRRAAHDLRGSAHVIVNASTVLTRDDLPDTKRTEISQALSVAATALSKLLTDLLDHARLEAGHEQRNVKAFDAARLVKEFCETARPLAADRNLFLRCEGPAALEVEGDAVKVQRILQNLVLNALQATQTGGVLVTWEAGSSPADPHHWALCVQDNDEPSTYITAHPDDPLLRATRAPVIGPAASLRRKTARLATSSAASRRPNGRLASAVLTQFVLTSLVASSCSRRCDLLGTARSAASCRRRSPAEK